MSDAAAADLAFTGFSPRLFEFFDALGAHQTRDWFHANRESYERHCRAPMAAFVEAVAFAFAAHDIPLTGSTKDSLFRIHRDTRFAKDKRPYKTNIAALLTRDGTKAGKGVFYISLGAHGDGFERGGMMGVGFYAPDADDLARLRGAIAADPQAWLEVEADLEAAGLSLLRGDALTRPPKGFEHLAGSPVIEALKLRRYHVWRPIPDANLFADSLIDEAVDFARAGLPLLQFGWRALSRI